MSPIPLQSRFQCIWVDCRRFPNFNFFSNPGKYQNLKTIANKLVPVSVWLLYSTTANTTRALKSQGNNTLCILGDIRMTSIMFRTQMEHILFQHPRVCVVISGGVSKFGGRWGLVWDGEFLPPKNPGERRVPLEGRGPSMFRGAKMRFLWGVFQKWSIKRNALPQSLFDNGWTTVFKVSEFKIKIQTLETSQMTKKSTVWLKTRLKKTNIIFLASSVKKTLGWTHGCPLQIQKTENMIT